LSKFQDDPRGTVSDWIQSTLLRSGVPVAEIAAKIGKSEDLIYKWANKNAEQCIPAHALITLISTSGDHTILRELAEMFGFDLLPKRISLPANGNLLETLKALVKALEGEVVEDREFSRAATGRSAGQTTFPRERE